LSEATRLVTFAEHTWPDLAGPDPYDALNSSLVRRLAGSGRWRRIAWLQGLRLLPWDMRPLLGVRPHTNPKTVSLFARAYLRLAHMGVPHAEQRARALLAWLETHAVDGYSGMCWGYSFAWQSRRLWLDAGQPSGVCTAFVARAFLEAFLAWGEEEHLAVARSSAQFMLRDLPRVEGCISYIPQHAVLVHNANVLAAAVLAQVWQSSGGANEELRQVAERAVAFTIAEQRPDGSWLYDSSSAARDSFVDGFHTGFVLEAIDDIAHTLGVGYAEPLSRGLGFYRERMIGADGRPRRMLDRAAPTDIRDCAEALLVLERFGCAAQRAAVLDWTVSHMRDARGFFVYQSGGRLAQLNHIAYPRWQGWMLLALTQPARSDQRQRTEQSIA
jgi:hypothetical protein